MLETTEDEIQEVIHDYMADIISDPSTYTCVRDIVRTAVTIDGKELDWSSGSEAALLFDKVRKEYIEKLSLLFKRV